VAGGQLPAAWHKTLTEKKMTNPTIPTPQDDDLVLQDTTTQTTDFNGTANFDMGEGYAPSHGGMQYKFITDVTGLDLSNADETYSIVFEQSTTGSGGWTTVATQAVTSTGMKNVQGAIGQRYVRARLDVNGTTPSITYKIWINPITQ